MQLRFGLRYNAIGMLGLALFVTLSTGCGKDNHTASTRSNPAPARSPAPEDSLPEDSLEPSDSSEAGDGTDAGKSPEATRVTKPGATEIAPAVVPPKTAPKASENREQWNQSAANDENSQFDSNLALKGMGVWIEIGGDRFFKPNIRGDEPNWQPYQHGYWTFDTDLGWTWVSFDKWGAVTEHYGIWRHHTKQGWLWLPFADRRYRPHAVTWFDDGDYVGWYPYFAEHVDGYQLGAAEGFDDGFWDGYQTASQAATSDFSFHVGFTIVNRADVTAENIWPHRVGEQYLNVIAARGCSMARVRAGRVGFYPGGSREGAYEFIQGQARAQAEVGRAGFVVLDGGQKMMSPPNVRPTPKTEAGEVVLGMEKSLKPRARPVRGSTAAPAVLAPTVPRVEVTPLPSVVPTSKVAESPAKTEKPAAIPVVKPVVVTKEKSVVPVSLDTIVAQPKPTMPNIKPRPRPKNLVKPKT